MKSHKESDAITSLLSSLEEVDNSTTIGHEEGGSGVDINKLLELENLEFRRIETKLKSEELENVKQDRKQREDFSDKIYNLTKSYLIIVGVILCASGLRFWHAFELSDNVLIALLTTTTANIIGLLVIIVTYLFPKRRN